MFFSVIIPIFNAERTLARCLNSVKNQTFSDFEVIMVNDGSSDASERICKEYAEKDPRFIYIWQENAGVSAARNRGMDAAKGDYITFLDSDDVYYDSYLASFSDMIRSHPHCGHFWCAFEELDEDLQRNGQVYTIPGEERYAEFDRSDIMLLHENNVTNAPINKAYRRTLLQGVRMDESLSLGEDLLFNLEYLNVNPNQHIVFDHVPQYGYINVSDSSLTHKYRVDAELEVDRQLAGMQQYLEKWRISGQGMKLFDRYKLNLYFYVLNNTFHSDNNMSRREKIRRNSNFMKSEKFQNALRGCEQQMNPYYAFCYKIGWYRGVLLLDALIECKRKLGKRQNKASCS